MVLVFRHTLPLSLLALTAVNTRLRTASVVAVTHTLHRAQCPISALGSSRSFSTIMSDSASTGPAQPDPSSPEHLQQMLSTLLASPHIHFNQPHGIGGIRLGHGPIDLFSTRFTNYFTHEATGSVAGTEVDKEGLKQALLALQKKWDPENAQFVAQEGALKVCRCLVAH